MTIKGKLIANLLMTSAIILGICVGGYSSLRFIQDRFSYIAEKSTPYQMRTVEFERELQNSITSLLKVNAARTPDEYAGFRSDAEHSLENVITSQAALENMKKSAVRLEVANEFRQIASEIFSSAEARIQSDKAAYEANVKIAQNLKISADQLGKLELRVRNLQATRATSFSRALENTTQFSNRLRGVEDLRNQIKELQAVLSTTYNTTTKTHFLISRGKVNMLLGRIAKNGHMPSITSDVQSMTGDVKRFLELQSDVLSSGDNNAKQMTNILLQNLSEANNRMQLTLNQEIELLAARLNNETKQQGIIYEQSNSANIILLTNSEMVGLGLTVTGQVNRLFSFTTTAELDSEVDKIKTLFPKIKERADTVERLLLKLGAHEELQMLKTSYTSLEKLREELYVANGIIATLRKKLLSIEQAHKAADKLNVIVTSQASKGKESISNARLEQETAIAAVNRMIQDSVTSIVISGVVAILIGIGFGFWILRSIVSPLKIILEAVRLQKKQVKNKAELAESVAAGNLDLNVDIAPQNTVSYKINNDEFGKVLQELVGMYEAQVILDGAFRDMTVSLRAGRDGEQRRNRIKNGLFDLNTILRNGYSINVMADKVLSFLIGYLGAGVGILYGFEDAKELLIPLARYAVKPSERLQEGFRIGEGIVGEAALQRKTITLNDVPAEYLSIGSAVGSRDPLMLVVMPVLYNDVLAGVIEFGTFSECSEDDFEFLKHALEGIAIALNVSRSQQLVADLLEQTQLQAEELRSQQEELLQNNEELMERAQVLEKIQKQIRKNV